MHAQVHGCTWLHMDTSLIQTHRYKLTCIYTCTHSFIHMCIHTCVHTHIHIYIHTYTPTCTHAYVHASVCAVCTYTSKCTCTYTCTNIYIRLLINIHHMQWTSLRLPHICYTYTPLAGRAHVYFWSVHVYFFYNYGCKIVLLAISV